MTELSIHRDKRNLYVLLFILVCYKKIEIELQTKPQTKLQTRRRTRERISSLFSERSLGTGSSSKYSISRDPSRATSQNHSKQKVLFPKLSGGRRAGPKQASPWRRVNPSMSAQPLLVEPPRTGGPQQTRPTSKCVAKTTCGVK